MVVRVNHYYFNCYKVNSPKSIVNVKLTLINFATDDTLRLFVKLVSDDLCKEKGSTKEGKIIGSLIMMMIVQLA